MTNPPPSYTTSWDTTGQITLPICSGVASPSWWPV